jgi:hypothetical protein
MSEEQELRKQQAYNLWFSGRSKLESEAEAIQFLKSVRFALRYNATSSLPLGAIHQATNDVFEKAHADVIRAAKKLTVEKAARQLIESYLEAAIFVTQRKLASMFRLLLSEAEIDAIVSNKIERTKKYWIWKIPLLG